MYAEFAIFGAKKRLKTLIILAGEGGVGLDLFADALAATSAGPDQPRLKSTSIHVCGRSLTNDLTDGRSFAAVVAHGNPIESHSELENNGLIKQTWVTLWGLEPALWSFNNNHCVNPQSQGPVASSRLFPTSQFCWL